MPKFMTREILEITILIISVYLFLTSSVLVKRYLRNG
jgi:hypothetical protein